MTQEYPNKKQMSFEEMISLLKERGLVFDDEKKVINYLKHIGYYRLSGYAIPFFTDEKRNNFMNETTFDNILNIYIFDRKLRVLILEAIERIEVSLRAVIVDCLSQHFEDPFFYSNYNNFAKGSHLELSLFLTKITSQIKTSDETYNKAFNSKFGHVAYPYAWIAFQNLTFGALVTFIRKICGRDERLIVAKRFGFDNLQLFESWILSIHTLRNLCAHHARCWNREFRVVPQIPENFLERITRFVDYNDPILYFADYKDLKRLIKQKTFAPSVKLRTLLNKIINFGELIARLTTAENKLILAKDLSWSGLEYKLNLTDDEKEILHDIEKLLTGNLRKFVVNLINSSSINIIDYQALKNFLKIPIIKRYFFISEKDKHLLSELISLANGDDAIANIISHSERKKFPSGQQQLNEHILSSDRIFAQLVVVWYFLKQINPKSSWSQRLYSLMQEHHFIQGELNTNVTQLNMGFPDIWYHNDFWQITI